MARYLRHFTAVGDEQPGQWEDEELHVHSDELGPATGQYPETVTFRDSLKRLYSSTRFQVTVVCLVILDAIFVLAELLIDLSIIKLEHGHLAPEVFHYLSLALLTFFMLEIGGKLFAYRLEFFQHKFEVFDALVVILSFVLDIVYLFHEDVFDGMGLLILLRLWRVARIINGILVSVKTRAEQKMHKLKGSYDHLVQRVTELQQQIDKLAASKVAVGRQDRKGASVESSICQKSLKPLTACVRLSEDKMGILTVAPSVFACKKTK
ncbi:voltage-gated hydrogen channel 1 isoform X3 [Corythoichthys intestinalis]|nr:voltage-gated hydrogen channel 1 isoform X3 [Corythoichthys intestinalis]XP_057705519.1 voltage-gated hydrogen channel 1 isoform X3 [Corythoichthys intestinalis]XP_057705520.1 voltage-gated hydrogen channel 1 isoform X3 [Corythoichthys intestinalis]XP_057705521.1 voltage-gated hydrogen channel 1 isoform X3 [Corythoichthys intestinalis]